MKSKAPGGQSMKRLVEEWVSFAERDVMTAEEIIDNPLLTRIVAFHCQQAIEKYFKGYLLEHDKPLIRIHNLSKLYEMTKKIKDLEIDEDILVRINDTYIEDRYPGDLGMLPDGVPTNEEAQSFLQFAKEIEAKIKRELR
jgi:HEPN domain-containing protein